MSKREIWDYWRRLGYSEKATAAIMGNIGPESAFQSNNVEDRCPLSDAEYTACVDNGTISRQQFCFDGYGYGYYQHTFHERKAGLFDLAKARGRSVSDSDTQHDWANTELHQAEYSAVLRTLQSDASLAEMTRVFMCQFERPGDQSQAAINYRIGIAKEILHEFAGTAVQDPGADLTPSVEKYWPPRMLDKSMTGPDVFALQGILCARGYYKQDMSGRFDSGLDAAVRDFQRAAGLSEDGVAGPLTWAALCRL